MEIRDVCSRIRGVIIVSFDIFEFETWNIVPIHDLCTIFMEFDIGNLFSKNHSYIIYVDRMCIALAFIAGFLARIDTIRF